MRHRLQLHRHLLPLLPGLLAIFAVVPHVHADGQEAGDQFDRLSQQFLQEFPAFSPVSATLLGDHRFDSQLDDVSQQQRDRKRRFLRQMLAKAEAIDATSLSKDQRVDWELLCHELRSQLFYLDRYQSWQWDPLEYTAMTGDAVYGLMARDFAPLPKRLEQVASRLEQFPRLLNQVRTTLDIRRVPKIHADTAVNQNKGVLSLLRHMVEPHVDGLPPESQQRLRNAIQSARDAVEQHQHWLETEVAPRATAPFRIGAELYDQKLAMDLNSSLSRTDIQRRARAELANIRQRMYALSQPVYKQLYPYTTFPKEPSEAYQQAIIRAALEEAYRDQPDPDRILEAANDSLVECIAFVQKHQLMSIPPDPVEIIPMPEFRRGVSLAYCDSPGPLDVGQKTFYAVSPLPANWTSKQVASFLREYNLRSLHNLTIHEAVPGHFLQLAHANRYPSLLRKVLSSGVFIEGWAVYTEHMMAEEGYYHDDPLMKLIAMKWYLRGIANALLDQSVHAGEMTRDEAMHLMIEQTFQEEREAAAKWVRAQLTAAQLSTYFVGAQEHWDMRRAMEAKLGDQFQLRSYHNDVLSHGSPPVRYVRKSLLDAATARD